MSQSRIVSIFSYHLYHQRRRGGMHWICDGLRRLGWDVRFITCDFSLITRLKGDRRTRYGEIRGLNRLERVSDNLSVGVISTPFHPLGRANGLVGRMLGALTSRYPWPAGAVASSFARGADLVVVESCGALMMIDAIRKATAAPIVYRVSDNLAVVRPVPSLLAAEARAVERVDAVSLASENLARKFAASGRIRLDPMGLDKALFDAACHSPYPADGRRKVVISGSSSLDLKSMELAARARPDWDFIQIGSAANLPRLPNIRDLGEMPFQDVVPWVKFADVGFAPYLVRPGFEYQAEHSNRLLQYVYCGLPSVVPEELAGSTRPHFLGYRAGDADSIGAALDAAAGFDRGLVPRHTVIDWQELAQRIAGVADQMPASPSADQGSI